MFIIIHIIIRVLHLCLYHIWILRLDQTNRFAHLALLPCSSWKIQPSAIAGSCHMIFEDNQKSPTSTGPSCLGQQRLLSKGELPRNDESKYKSNRMKTFSPSGLAQKTAPLLVPIHVDQMFGQVILTFIPYQSHEWLTGGHLFWVMPRSTFIEIIWKKPWGPAAPHQRLRVKHSKRLDSTRIVWRGSWSRKFNRICGPQRNTTVSQKAFSSPETIWDLI